MRRSDNTRIKRLLALKRLAGRQYVGDSSWKLWRPRAGTGHVDLTDTVYYNPNTGVVIYMNSIAGRGLDTALRILNVEDKYDEEE